MRPSCAGISLGQRKRRCGWLRQGNARHTMSTVLGSTNLDLIGTVSRIPKPGETVPGGEFSIAAGGKGANQALAARRAGAEVRMFCAAGTDGFGEDGLPLLHGG